MAHSKKQAKLNTPSGKYVDVAPIVKTEEEAQSHSGEALLPGMSQSLRLSAEKEKDLVKFNEVMERLEKRRHRHPRRHY